jgi:hypothetical protein
MVTNTAQKSSTSTGPEQHKTVEEKIQALRELFADAPDLGKKALENALHELKSQASDLPPPVESAGRRSAPITTFRRFRWRGSAFSSACCGANSYPYRPRMLLCYGIDARSPTCRAT